jgi:hypothetical protein
LPREPTPDSRTISFVYSDIQFIKQFSAFQRPDIGSSVKLWGVQIRGKNAAAIQMVYAVFALAAFAVQVAVIIIVFLVQMLLILLQVLFAFLSWLLPILWDGCVRAGQGSADPRPPTSDLCLYSHTPLLPHSPTPTLRNSHTPMTSDLLLAPLYLRIDDQCVQDGGRTRLQDLLLEDYAAVNRLMLHGRPDCVAET